MARQLARKLGVHPDDNEPGNETSDGDGHDDDNKKWFYKPMDYVDFKESLRGMETDEEQETLRREAHEHRLEDDTEIETQSNSDNLHNTVDDKEVKDIHQIVHPVLDSFHTDKEAEKKSDTLLVPDVGRRYKRTVTAELRNNPELSTDHLRRLQGAGTSMESENEKAGDSGSTDSNDSVGLFDNCVFYDPSCTGKFILGQVQRMHKKGTKGFIEYVRPVDISNKPVNVEVIASKYCCISEDSHLYYHQETVVAMPLTSLICKVHLEINQEEERDDFYALSQDTCIITEFLQSVET